MAPEASQTANIYYDWDEGGYRTQSGDTASQDEALAQFNADDGGASPPNAYDRDGNKINNNGGDVTDYMYDEDGGVISSTSVGYAGYIMSTEPLRGYGFKGFAIASGGLNQDNTIANIFIENAVFKPIFAALFGRAALTASTSTSEAAYTVARESSSKFSVMAKGSATDFFKRLNPNWNGTFAYTKGAFSTTSFTTQNGTKVLFNTTSSSTGKASVKIISKEVQILFRFTEL